jgi:hypothetical protein
MVSRLIKDTFSTERSAALCNAPNKFTQRGEDITMHFRSNGTEVAVPVVQKTSP